jgi:hypothetical protein
MYHNHSIYSSIILYKAIALAGATIAQERLPLNLPQKELSSSAGNFYINDKCTRNKRSFN